MAEEIAGGGQRRSGFQRVELSRQHRIFSYSVIFRMLFIEQNTIGRCEICLVAPREGFALVPCGHARFCERLELCEQWLCSTPVSCAVQTSTWSCVSSCRLNTDTCSDRTAY